MESILFSCVGTTDPVRGIHDGPMLHILRHYRPKAVYLLITKEIHDLAAKDQRFSKAQQWIRDHWDGYDPQWNEILCPVTNAHDMDTIDPPIHEALHKIAQAHPDAQILLNVTSGTPQMQMVLSHLAMDTRYRTLGIQVSNYSRKSGDSDRTNKADYDIDLELELNEDELPGADNRCIVPKMYTFQRDDIRRQITTLLENRDFFAAAQLAGHMPEQLAKLVRHLSARSQLNSSEAQRLAGEITGLPFKLYSFRTGSRGKYSQVSEYYLLMKNLVYAKQYPEFIIRMEPITLTLQLALLEKKLLDQGVSMEQFIYLDCNEHLLFDPGMLETAFPQLYQHYIDNKNPNWPVKKNTISSTVCDILLGYFADLPEICAHLFEHYAQLKNLRNSQAHQLTACTAQDIMDDCGVDCMTILRELESTIIKCYDACDPSIFSVYDKSIQYIAANL